MTPLVRDAERRLLAHPLLRRCLDPDAVRLFMSHHVFAVWDFMSLLMRLERDLVGSRAPWLPPRSARLARFVREIALGEECDVDGRDGFASHFEIYLDAMDEVGADRRPIDGFVAALRRGASPESALAHPDVPVHVRAFVAHTLSIALDPAIPTACVAAAFVHGREAIIPEMFRALIATVQAGGGRADRLVYYLERHVEVDGDSHGPLAARLLSELVGDDDSLARLAEQVAIASLEKRIELWDGVLAAIDARPRETSTRVPFTDSASSRV